MVVLVDFWRNISKNRKKSGVNCTSCFPVCAFDDIRKEAIIEIRCVGFLEFIFGVDGQVELFRLFTEVFGDGLPCVRAAIHNGELFPPEVVQQSDDGLCHLDIGRLQPCEGFVYRTVRHCSVRTFLRKQTFMMTLVTWSSWFRNLSSGTTYSLITCSEKLSR